jgi:hypothetical protein
MTLDTLARTVNRIVPDADWVNNIDVPTIDSLSEIAAKQGDRPWIAGTNYGENELHAVVVKSIDFETGEVTILDPQPMIDSATGKLVKYGTEYTQTIEAFLLDWDGEAVVTVR